MPLEQLEGDLSDLFYLLGLQVAVCSRYLSSQPPFQTGHHLFEQSPVAAYEIDQNVLDQLGLSTVDLISIVAPIEGNEGRGLKLGGSWNGANLLLPVKLQKFKKAFQILVVHMASWVSLLHISDARRHQGDLIWLHRVIEALHPLAILSGQSRRDRSYIVAIS